MSLASLSDQDFATICRDPELRKNRYQEMVRAYYNRVTSVYRCFWGDSYHFALFQGGESREQALLATEHSIAEEGRFAPGMRILDVGCGVGGPALNIAEFSGAEITGIDLLESHARIASQRAAARSLDSRVRFLTADALNLPFPARCFDRVYMFEAGCHTPDKARLYSECSRVLRAGGEFLGLDWMRADSLTLAEQHHIIEPICRFCSLPGMISPTELSEMLEQAGFQILVSEDASAYSGIIRNWEPVDPKMFDLMRQKLAQKSDVGLDLINLGGAALLQGAIEGAFIIGHWRAVKP